MPRGGGREDGDMEAVFEGKRKVRMREVQNKKGVEILHPEATHFCTCIYFSRPKGQAGAQKEVRELMIPYLKETSSCICGTGSLVRIGCPYGNAKDRSAIS